MYKNMHPIEGKPKIDYPCEWSYTLIGKDSDQIRAAVQNTLLDKEYRIEKSNRSSGGKYTSVCLRTIVNSQEQRDKYYSQLGSHEWIKMVL